MTDAELIKALEICTTIGESCVECPFFGDEGCNTRLKECFHNLINCQKAEIERLNELVVYNASCATRLHKDLFNAKAEAIKEFAERLKEKAMQKFDWNEYVDTEEIDNLVKEMVGETDV